MTPFYTAEDFKSLEISTHGAENCARIANAKLERERPPLVVGEYEVSQFDDGSLWITNGDSEGMQINSETMDKIWREHF